MRLHDIKEIFTADDASEDDASYVRFKKIVFALVAIFGIVIVGAVIVLVLTLVGSSSHGVDLSLTIPDSVTAGVPFDVIATLTNNQGTALNDATLRLDLPQNILYLGTAASEGGSATTDHVGDVAAGGLVRHTFRIMDTGAVNAKDAIRVTASYAAPNQASRYEVKATKDVTVSKTPVTLEVKLPDHVISGSSFEFQVNYKNTTSFDIPDVALTVNYPNTFQYESSSLPAEALNNLWKLGTLSAGAAGSITIRGTYTGPSDAPFQMPASMTAHAGNQEYPIANSETSASLAPSPVTLSVLVNNQSQLVLHPSDALAVTIHYENKSGVALSNFVVKANLAGSMLDQNSIQSDARIDPATNWLVWDSTNMPNFALLDAGASGDLTIKASTKTFFPIRNTNDKNYAITVTAKLESPTVPAYMSAKKLTASTVNTVKLGGLASLSAQLYYQDPEVDVENTGPFPPQVGKATEYLVHWTIRNFSTDANDVTVRAHLRPNVVFEKSIQNTTSESPSYDTASGDVVWHIDTIPATKGVIGTPAEAIFQVRATPSASDAGQFMQIMSESILSATDGYTGLPLNSRGVGLSTALPDDKTVDAGTGKVQ